MGTGGRSGLLVVLVPQQRFRLCIAVTGSERKRKNIYFLFSLAWQLLVLVPSIPGPLLSCVLVFKFRAELYMRPCLDRVTKGEIIS